MRENIVRVLVVDDSPTARALIIGVLSIDPELVVVGEARDGAEAVEMVRRLRPDVVTMDIRMPNMDGFEATRRIMAETPTPIVVVSGTLDASDVEMSMHVLRAGALTALAKPDGPSASQFESSQWVFARTVKTLAAVKVVRQREAGQSIPAVAPRPQRPRRAKIVGIGGSTGGPAALRVVLERLPADFGAPVLVVQHISPGFMSGLVQWLGAMCKLPVKLATQSEPLRSGTIYVSPEECHLRVLDGRVQVDASPPIGGFRPAATAVFESLAQGYGGGAVAVILTGMGRDGVDGLQQIRARRGYVIAQDEASSAVFFLANMSHELRTPLNAILGFSELLEEQMAGALNPRQTQYVSYVRQSGEHLLALVNDILDISKIEANKLCLERIWLDPMAAIKATCGIVQPLADKNGVILALEVDDTVPSIFADPVRIKQVLYNLLSNAVKFTPRGGHVTLRTSTQGALFGLTIEDTGVGIAPEDIPRLFREFERLQSPTGGKSEGTGLGLALTKRLVEMHGGSISVESEPGRGSTFTVWLPNTQGSKSPSMRSPSTYPC